MKNIMVSADKAWEFGISTVFTGGRSEIARREIEPGVGLSVFIEGYEDNMPDDIGFDITVAHIGVDPERGEVWREYAHSPEQCQEIVMNIYLAFIGEEIRKPWES